MTRSQALSLGATAIIFSIGAAVWAYQQLPETVPTHWDLAGNVNGHSSRLVAVALMPATMVFTWLFMLVVPTISPKGFGLQRSATAFYESFLAVIGIIAIMCLPILRAELSGKPPSTAFIILPIGALLVILGNLMGKLRKNFFIGVRTPWTLANDEVWLKTNRFGGRLMLICGLVIIILSLFAHISATALLICIIAIAMMTTSYSYVVYKRVEGLDNSQRSG